MFKVKNNMAPNNFNNEIKTMTHKYSIINFNEPLKTNRYSKYARTLSMEQFLRQ